MLNMRVGISHRAYMSFTSRHSSISPELLLAEHETNSGWIFDAVRAPRWVTMPEFCDETYLLELPRKKVYSLMMVAAREPANAIKKGLVEEVDAYLDLLQKVSNFLSICCGSFTHTSFRNTQMMILLVTHPAALSWFDTLCHFFHARVVSSLLPGMWGARLQAPQPLLSPLRPCRPLLLALTRCLLLTVRQSATAWRRGVMVSFTSFASVIVALEG